MGNAEGRRSDLDDENIDEMFPSPLKISLKNPSSSGSGDRYAETTSADDIVKASIPINSTLSVSLHITHFFIVSNDQTTHIGCWIENVQHSSVGITG